MIETVDINSWVVSYKQLSCPTVSNFHRSMQWGLAMVIADVGICPLIRQEELEDIRLATRQRNCNGRISVQGLVIEINILHTDQTFDNFDTSM